jgi:LacI family repressor for deo operon, udp, cdd, tsx, nupC, and nupG
VGIQEIAAATGLSKATVSRALRGLPTVAETTIDAVRRAADELGYVPSSAAAGLATGHQRAVGVVLPVIDRWFTAKALGGVDAELRAAGYDLVLYNLGGPGGDGHRAFRRAMLRQRVDALVLLTLVLDETERRELQVSELPTIIVGGPAHDLRNVGVDDHHVATLAVQHVTGLGHRDVAYVGGQDEAGMNVAVPYRRRDGFTDAMGHAGRAVRPDWYADGRFSFAGGVAAGNELLDVPARARPTAVVCASDEMALGVVVAAHRLGLAVPRDLSVTGVDGHEYGDVLGLTTVAQDPEAQGRVAARTVVAEVQGAPPTVPLPAPVRLVVRRTTAPPSR